MGRCRWSINADEPLLFVKYDWRLLNILDAEKKALILKSPVEIEPEDRKYSGFIIFIFPLLSIGKRGLTV